MHVIRIQIEEWFMGPFMGLGPINRILWSSWSLPENGYRGWWASQLGPIFFPRSSRRGRLTSLCHVIRLIINVTVAQYDLLVVSDWNKNFYSWWDFSMIWVVLWVIKKLMRQFLNLNIFIDISFCKHGTIKLTIPLPFYYIISWKAHFKKRHWI